MAAYSGTRLQKALRERQLTSNEACTKTVSVDPTIVESTIRDPVDGVGKVQLDGGLVRWRKLIRGRYRELSATYLYLNDTRLGDG